MGTPTMDTTACHTGVSPCAQPHVEPRAPLSRHTCAFVRTASAAGVAGKIWKVVSSSADTGTSQLPTTVSKREGTFLLVSVAGLLEAGVSSNQQVSTQPAAPGCGGGWSAERRSRGPGRKRSPLPGSPCFQAKTARPALGSASKCVSPQEARVGESWWAEGWTERTGVIVARWCNGSTGSLGAGELSFVPWLCRLLAV